MSAPHSTANPESWRVVVITNISDGLVYKLADGVSKQLGHKVVGVITSAGPKRRRSDYYLSVVAAVSPGVDVLVSNHPERWAEMIAPLKPDLIICGGMPWLLPLDLIELPRLGSINFHPALLPKHRGPCAVEWALRNGDAEIGFTVHRLDGSFDTGPILGQSSVPLEDDDDFESVFGRLAPRMPEIMFTAFATIASGEPGRPQDESQASYAGFFEPEWRFIDWSRPARTIHNQVRSWTGFRDTPKGAFGEVNGQKLQINRTRIVAAANPSNEAPGTTLQRADSSILIQCGDAPLEIVEWLDVEPEIAS